MLNFRTVKAGTQIGLSNAETIISDALKFYAEDSAQIITFDLSEVKAIERPAGTLLCHALVSNLNGADISIIPPESSPVTKLAQAGFGFAIAHRSGNCEIQGMPADNLFLKKWKYPWTSGTPSDPELFPREPDDTAPAIYGRENNRSHAAFINPHITARIQNEQVFSTRITSWLRSIVPPRAFQVDQEFIQDIQQVIYELLANVAGHAFEWRKSDLLSLVQLSITRGNRQETRDRVWVSIIDNGPGLIVTARPKIQDQSLSDEDLIKALFTRGYLQTNSRARGFGLPLVRTLCMKRPATELTVITGNMRLRYHNSSLVALQTSGLDIQGTVVIAKFEIASNQ
jgi:anti-sigma regulatory factor (Ser/Thr protein kinase)